MPSQFNKNENELIKLITDGKSEADQQADVVDLRNYGGKDNRFRFRHLRLTPLLIPFLPAFAAQIVAALLVILAALPPQVLPIQPGMMGSISLAIIILTLPATFFGPLSALTRRIANKPHLNSISLRLAVRTAAGATIPTVALSLFTQATIITIISILVVIASITPIIIVVIVKPPIDQVRYALTPIIAFSTLTIVLAALPLTFTIFGIILAIVSTGVLLLSLTWGIVSAAALTRQRLAVG